METNLGKSMDTFIQWFIPLYFTAYFLIAFVWRSYLVWKRTGINPVVLPSSDDAYGFVATAFKICIVAVFVLAAVHSFAPEVAGYFLPVTYLHSAPVRVAGVVLLIISLLWIAVAQAQMGASWRIGIDQANKTNLVRTGLFRVSRNPIFLGMVVSLLGFFFVFPSTGSLLLLVSAFLLISVQIRLEEEHLFKLHGESFTKFKTEVRRWL